MFVINDEWRNRNKASRKSIPIGLCTLLLCLLLPVGPSWSDPVTVSIRTISVETQRAIPAKIRFEQEDGTPVLPSNEYDYRKWFVIDGEKKIKIEPGQYTVIASQGIETIPTRRDVTIGLEGGRIELPIRRWIDMNDRGWWSGDMHIHRPLETIESLVRAEDLNVAPVLTYWNEGSMFQGKSEPKKAVHRISRGKYYSVKNEEHEHGDGAIMIFNMKSILPVAGYQRWYPDALSLIDGTHRQNAWVEIEKPFWNDYPLWLALGRPHSLGIVNNHFNENGTLNNEAWGRPRDSRYSEKPIGLAHYVMDLYYKALNCGFHLTATGGSASGVLDNPVGQNRTYVYLGRKFSYSNWFSALKKGRNFTTNGPMLFARVDYKLPGSSIRQKNELHVDVSASALNGVKRIEWIGDGRVLASYAISPPRKKVRIQDSIETRNVHWLACRVFEDCDEKIVRFGHTSPFYIQGDHPVLSHRDYVRFFLDWLDQRIEHSSQVENIPDSAARKIRIDHLEKAKRVFYDMY